MRNFFLILFCGVINFFLHAQILYPEIKSYGGVKGASFATNHTDSTMDYKIVSEIGRQPENNNEVHEGLDAIARMYNLHVYAGIPQNQIHLVVVLFAGSTRVVLSNEEYKNRFEVDNPNIQIIKELKDAGVKVIVCGQSVMKAEIDPATVNPNVTIAISRMTAVSTFQMKGYGFFKM